MTLFFQTLLVLFFCVPSQPLAAMVLSYSAPELTEMIAGSFPVTREFRILKASMTLNNPAVYLPRDTKGHLGLTLRFDGTSKLTDAISGSLAIEGRLTYEGEGKFYLENPDVKEIHFNEEKMIKHEKIVRRLLTSLLTEWCKAAPIYTLKKNDLKHVVAKSILKKIWVESDLFKIELSPF